MKKQLHLNEHIWEAMESCRPGTNDLADPALSHLETEIAANPQLEKIFDSIEHFDINIGAAFQDVPVPPGLAPRILDRLARARVENIVYTAMNADPDHVPTIDPALSLPPNVRRKISRRLMLLTGGLLSAAAVLFFALWLNMHNVQSYSEQAILDEAIRFFDADTSHAGFLLTDKSPPKAYPFSRAVFFSKGIRWREIRDLLGRSGIAYDLPDHDGGRATLYVVEQSVQQFGNEPRLQPFATGGYYTSAWQESGLLYVLVVQGRLQTYQNHLNLHTGPVALSPFYHAATSLM